MKTRATDTDRGGVRFQADPEVHPGIFQLAEVSCFLVAVVGVVVVGGGRF